MARATWCAIAAAVTLAPMPGMPAKAQFTIPGLTFQPEMTPSQQRRQILPFITRLTNCVAKRALSDPAGPLAYKLGNFDAYVIGQVDQCPGFENQLVSAYDQVYGEGQGATFLREQYSNTLSSSVLKRIRPQIEASVADLRRQDEARVNQEEEQRADDAAHARQAEAERQRADAEAERQAAIAKAEADKAKALERAAAQQAEAERLKQVAIADRAAKLLAAKTLDCARTQLRSLIKSGESSDALTSASMTICDSEIDHFISAGIQEYHLEHEIKDDDPADGLLREKLKAETHDHIFALAVQAKAGVGDFAPASSN